MLENLHQGVTFITGCYFYNRCVDGRMGRVLLPFVTLVSVNGDYTQDDGRLATHDPE